MPIGGTEEQKFYARPWDSMGLGLGKAWSTSERLWLNSVAHRTHSLLNMILKS